jgi:hypothetical protein
MDELVQDWGYTLLDPPHPDSPGCGGLVVAIRQKPTGKHFDPQVLHLHLRDRKGEAEGMALSWILPQPASDHVCPGRVLLTDRADKRVQFFTFGGSLEMTMRPDEVVYALRSPAAFLELLGQEDSIPDQLAFETESLLSRAMVQWRQDERRFNRRLAEVDPLRFYTAVLHSLLLRHKQVDAMETVYPELDDVLLREKTWLKAQGLWPDEPLTLQELLSPA